ncbi:hypothetical protein B0T16DRAFT_400731 [Cercophora newfieldiana]|uniref:Secreted protein n=1 Tax=Cercophora newfieldiana TaxID=92897 RepID=A0AA39YQZ8_9PEZI|nr:hypothetical protein B0T16DRAFT_400731 [Cercophora newfieldiana]
MKLLQLLPALVVAVAAVDVRFWPEPGCGGGYHIICTNLNPNRCCGIARDNWEWLSIMFYGIDPNWNINYRAHGGGNCNTLVYSETVTFGTYWCLGHSRDRTLTGAGYSFVGKRSVGDEDQECARADTLVFDDGSKYNLTALDDGAFDSM